jgi:hypothetical protein
MGRSSANFGCGAGGRFERNLLPPNRFGSNQHLTRTPSLAELGVTLTKFRFSWFSFRQVPHYLAIS